MFVGMRLNLLFLYDAFILGDEDASQRTLGPVSRDVLLDPGASFGAPSPYLVLPAVLDLAEVTNDLVLRAQGLRAVDAVLVMSLNLPVLVGVEVLEVVNGVSPFGIGGILRVNLEGPLRRLHYSIDLNELLQGCLGFLGGGDVLKFDFVSVLEVWLLPHPQQHLDHELMRHEVAHLIALHLFNMLGDGQPSFEDIGLDANDGDLLWMTVDSHSVDLLDVEHLCLCVMVELFNPCGHNHGDYLGLLEELSEGLLGIFGILKLANDDALSLLFALQKQHV